MNKQTYPLNNPQSDSNLANLSLRAIYTTSKNGTINIPNNIEWVYAIVVGGGGAGGQGPVSANYYWGGGGGGGVTASWVIPSSSCIVGSDCSEECAWARGWAEGHFRAPADWAAGSGGLPWPCGFFRELARWKDRRGGRRRR